MNQSNFTDYFSENWLICSDEYFSLINSVKINWFAVINIFHWLLEWKLTYLIVKNIGFADESVKSRITDSISENLSDSDLESKDFEIFLNVLPYILKYY